MIMGSYNELMYVVHRYGKVDCHKFVTVDHTFIDSSTMTSPLQLY